MSGGRIDPELVASAYAFIDVLRKSARENGNPWLDGLEWHVLSGRRHLGEGDELVVLLPADQPLAALESTGWRLSFDARDAFLLRGRRVDGRWEIVDLESFEDHLGLLGHTSS